MSVESSGMVASIRLLASVGGNGDVVDRYTLLGISARTSYSPSELGRSVGAETLNLDGRVGEFVAVNQSNACGQCPSCASNNARVLSHSVLSLELNLVAADIGAVGGRIDNSGVVLVVDIHVCGLLTVGTLYCGLHVPSEPCGPVESKVGDGDVGLGRAVGVAVLFARLPSSCSVAPIAATYGGFLGVEGDARRAVVDNLAVGVVANLSLAYGGVLDDDRLALSVAALVLYVPGKAVLRYVAETLDDSVGLVGSLVAIGIHKLYCCGALPPRLGNASDILGCGELIGIFVALGHIVSTSSEASVLVVVDSDSSIVGAVFAAE